MAMGDHIWVRRIGYSHHGIDCGNGLVIHFTGQPGSKLAARIAETTIHEFSQGSAIRKVHYGRRRAPRETVRAARSRLGEAGYSLAWNNCQHFATWCCTGNADSDQVRTVTTSTAAGLAATSAAAVGIATVSGTGAAAGLSGAGVMSGLATAGGVIGAGAAMGPTVLATAPAAVGAGIVHYALRDDDRYDAAERSARRDGRHASKAAAAAAAAGAPVAVSLAGTTAGLSAAGISSGLASIGAIAGGGMAAGVGVLVAAPVISAAAVGASAYFVGRTIRRRRGRHCLSGDS